MPVPEQETTASAAQYKALAHPLRQRLLFTLDELDEATISQLAAQLGTLKGNVAHHLKVLEAAGLVVVSRTNTVRGGTERYFTRTTKQIHIPRETVDAIPGGAAGIIRAVADEMAETEAPVFLGVRHVRLTAAQIEALVETLQHVAHPEDLPDAGAGERRYAIALTVFPTP
ncbi:helix-turn-helix domain-containing protein [Phytomonospora sp. NPDC050363]|uniref:ArsR/SmtB family transcription factor n=1 Tax=Phytomonospora sp. NPDC050363 TaxID=3155642 RepID=UPI0033D1EAAD